LQPAGFASFADFLCALCGEKLLTAKSAKNCRKEREDYDLALSVFANDIEI